MGCAVLLGVLERREQQGPWARSQAPIASPVPLHRIDSKRGLREWPTERVHTMAAPSGAPATPSAFYKMLSVPDAVELILAETAPLPAVALPFQAAARHTLAADVRAAEPVPGFRASIKVGAGCAVNIGRADAQCLLQGLPAQPAQTGGCAADQAAGGASALPRGQQSRSATTLPNELGVLTLLPRRMAMRCCPRMVLASMTWHLRCGQGSWPLLLHAWAAAPPPLLISHVCGLIQCVSVLAALPESLWSTCCKHTLHPQSAIPLPTAHVLPRHSLVWRPRRCSRARLPTSARAAPCQRARTQVGWAAAIARRAMARAASLLPALCHRCRRRCRHRRSCHSCCRRRFVTDAMQPKLTGQPRLRGRC